MQLSAAELQELIAANKAWVEQLFATGKARPGVALAREGATVFAKTNAWCWMGRMPNQREAICGTLVLEAMTLTKRLPSPRPALSLRYDSALEIRPDQRRVSARNLRAPKQQGLPQSPPDFMTFQPSTQNQNYSMSTPNKTVISSSSAAQIGTWPFARTNAASRRQLDGVVQSPARPKASASAAIRWNAKAKIVSGAKRVVGRAVCRIQETIAGYFLLTVEHARRSREHREGLSPVCLRVRVEVGPSPRNARWSKNWPPKNISPTPENAVGTPRCGVRSAQRAALPTNKTKPDTNLPTTVDGFYLCSPRKNSRHISAWQKRPARSGRIRRARLQGMCRRRLGREMRAAVSQRHQTKSGETVVFSHIVYKSRKQRDAVNKKIKRPAHSRHVRSEQHAVRCRPDDLRWLQSGRRNLSCCPVVEPLIPRHA